MTRAEYLLEEVKRNYNPKSDEGPVYSTYKSGGKYKMKPDDKSADRKSVASALKDSNRRKQQNNKYEFLGFGAKPDDHEPYRPSFQGKGGRPSYLKPKPIAAQKARQVSAFKSARGVT